MRQSLTGYSPRKRGSALTPSSEGNHVHEKEGAVRCSRLGIKKTPLVRTITDLYITYGERKQLASI